MGEKHFRELRRRGLLSFSALHAPANGVSLCDNCHVGFDAFDYPGLVFFPTDLQYFIDFEEQDFEWRRNQHRGRGPWSARTVPNAQNYLQHQAAIVPPSAVGGLYRRMFLYPRSVNNQTIIGEGPDRPPKQWHGCPLAALAMAFHSLGSQSHLFPDDIKQQLRHLKDLYGRHDWLAGLLPVMRASSGKQAKQFPTAIGAHLPQAFDNNPDAICLGSGHAAVQQFHGQAGRTRDAQDLNPCRKRAHSDASSRSSRHESSDAPLAERHLPESSMPCVWGPAATSEEKINFYRGIYNIGQKPLAQPTDTEKHTTRTATLGGKKLEINVQDDQAVRLVRRHLRDDSTRTRGQSMYPYSRNQAKIQKTAEQNRWGYGH